MLPTNLFYRNIYKMKRIVSKKAYNIIKSMSDDYERALDDKIIY